MLLWRLTAHPDLGGEGGLFMDGRWHRRGHRVIYACEHPALAVLEVLANMRQKAWNAPATLQLISIEVTNEVKPDSLTLPEKWPTRNGWTQGQGSGWLAARRSLLLKVPSVLVPHAANMLLNPEHPDMATKVAVGSVEVFRFDQRLQ